MSRRSSSLNNKTGTGIDREIDSKYDAVKVVADRLVEIGYIATALSKVGQITVTQAVDLDMIEADTALNSTHKASTGADHTFIDQAVTVLATPTFAGVITSGLVDGRDVSVDGTKLDTIETSAKDDQVASDVPVTATGNLVSTNVQTALVELQSDVDTRLLGTSYNAADVLAKVITVDGVGSLLDADLLDGQQGAFYQNATNINAGTISDLYLPASISSDITGNAATTTKLALARNIALSGDVTGTVAFDGTANVTIVATVLDDSHAHVITNVDGLQLALDAKVDDTEKGAVNGVATLDAAGLVPATQLPSYVDDVLEFANLAGFPTTGVAGKIYVAIDTNKTYRWSGTVYVYITSGAVDSVAGKTGVVTLVKADVGLGLVDNTTDLGKPVSTAQQTALDLHAVDIEQFAIAMAIALG